MKGRQNKEWRNELAEIATMDDWSNMGCVTHGWVRRSPGDLCAESANSNVHANPFSSHSYTEATDSNTDACAANSNAYKHTNTRTDANT